MLFEDLNWMDVEEYLKCDDRIVLVTGSCEQHGYLSLLSDVRQPMAIATAAAERENVLVAPPLNAFARATEYRVLACPAPKSR